MHYKHLNLDYKIRQKQKKNEIICFLLNYFKKCAYLSNQKQKQLNIFLQKKSNIRKNSIKNICLETGLQRSIIPIFGVSRHVFRKKASSLRYPGIRKAS